VFDDDRRVSTNANGDFEIRALRPGRYTVVVEALGYKTVRTTVLVQGNGTAEIQMDPAPLPLPPVRAATALVTLSGAVTNKHTGEVAPYLTVRLDDGDQASTNAAGWFRFRRIAPGTHRITLEGFGWQPTEIEVDIPRDSTIRVVIDRDAVADGIIAAQIAKLSERVRSVASPLMTLDRKEFLFSRAPTPVDAIQGRGGLVLNDCYPSKVRACVGSAPPIVYIDEQRIPCGLDVLRGYTNSSIQRIEIIDHGNIVRVYTIWFIERMNEGRVVLQPIVPWDRRERDC
jgi:hypothetical protein